MHTDQSYFQTLVAAFVRGKLAHTDSYETRQALFTTALEALSSEEVEELIQLGAAHGLRLHKFKDTMKLARVRKVLGILKGLQPANLLDIGSGRGAFLWPLMAEFPTLPVTSLDILPQRVEDMLAVQRGGIGHLSAILGDVTTMTFPDRSFDVVTMLEVLEHIPATTRALSQVCRVARRWVIFSVPSKEDNNPEHIHLFNQHTLQNKLAEQGVTRVKFDFVPNHMIVVAKVAA